MASSTQQRFVTKVVVRDVEKRYKPARCYKFVLEVMWSDNSRHVVYRSYSEFFELHMSLVEAFPIEAGEIDENERILPKLSGSSFFQRTEVHKVAENRKFELSAYCGRLLQLQPKITQFCRVLRFFELQPEDVEVSHDSKTKTSTLKSLSKVLKKSKQGKRKSKDAIEVTSPLKPAPYLVIATYKSKGRGQINLNEGDHVDVIDKNSNGWWYVSCNGIEGWAPATFLDPLTPVSNAASTDEIQCLGGETFLSLRPYQAQLEDEITFDSNVVIEILNKVLDGWWIACYNGKVGYVPSTYLKPYSNPYLNPNFTSASASPKQPTPRRKTIKSTISTLPSADDLQVYRRVTEKRRQRSIKHQEPSFMSIPSLSALLGEMDDDGYMKPLFPDDDGYVSPDCRLTGAKDLMPTVSPPSPPNLPKSPARDPGRSATDMNSPSTEHVQTGEFQPSAGGTNHHDSTDVPPLYKAPSPPSSVNFHVKTKGPRTPPASSEAGLLKLPVKSPVQTPLQSGTQSKGQPAMPIPQSSVKPPVPTPPRGNRVKGSQSPPSIETSHNSEANPLLRQQIPAAAGGEPATPDYETICDPPEKSPTHQPVSPNLRPKVPPPKPPICMQTRLSKCADGDYQYEDLVLPLGSKQENHSPVRAKHDLTPPTERANQMPDTAKPVQHRKVLPLLPSKNENSLGQIPQNLLPTERAKRSPNAPDNRPCKKALPAPPPVKGDSKNKCTDSPSKLDNRVTQVADFNANNILEVKLKPVQLGVKDKAQIPERSDKPNPINFTRNTPNRSPPSNAHNSQPKTSGEGKIYEEMLVKPSQLKGKKAP